jgi:membrane-bound metal-dependent hydrolase YbcI (DUF457 family)
MIAGHFGFAAGVKAVEKQTPLWSLMLASVWLDVAFVPLLLTGIETSTPVPGTPGGYGNAIIHADYTHSLVGALALSAIFGGVAAILWGRRNGWVLAGVVFSHWLLDLLFHRGDMPILPGNIGNLPRLGFGLWQVPMLAAAIELAIVVVGGVLYWRAARQAGTRRGGATLATLSGALTLLGGIAVLLLDFTGVLG